MSRGAAGAIETSDADGWAARRPQVCGRHAWIRPGFSDAARRGWPRKSSAWNQHRSARLPARTEPALADHTGTQEKRGTNGESGRAPETRIRAAQCGFQARPTSTRETTVRNRHVKVYHAGVAHSAKTCVVVDVWARAAMLASVPCSGSTVEASRWCSHSCPAARDFAGRRSSEPQRSVLWADTRPTVSGPASPARAPGRLCGLHAGVPRRHAVRVKVAPPSARARCRSLSFGRALCDPIRRLTLLSSGARHDAAEEAASLGSGKSSRATRVAARGRVRPRRIVRDGGAQRWFGVGARVGRRCPIARPARTSPG